MTATPTLAPQDEVKEQAKEAAKDVNQTGRTVGHATRLALSETGYAALGLWGFTLDLMRHTPSAVRTLGVRSVAGVKVAGDQAARGFVALSRRGHKMLGSIHPQERREHAQPKGVEGAPLPQPTGEHLPAPAPETAVAEPLPPEPATTPEEPEGTDRSPES